MTGADSKYGDCSNSLDILMHMQRKFIGIIDRIACDGRMTNKKLYLEVKEKLQVEKVQNGEISDLIEDSDISVVSGEADDEKKLLDTNVLWEVATAEESAIESHAHSFEVATAQEDNASAMFILDHIIQNMEKEKEYEKVRMAAKRKEMEQKNMVMEEKEQEDDEHRKSRHIVTWFVGKVDVLQEFKMLGCDDCNVSFDCKAVVLVPKNTEALKYVVHETTGHMASLFNKCESLLFDQLVQKDKESLSC
jgi:hypothetical protein